MIHVFEYNMNCSKKYWNFIGWNQSYIIKWKRFGTSLHCVVFKQIADPWKVILRGLFRWWYLRTFSWEFFRTSNSPTVCISFYIVALSLSSLILAELAGATCDKLQVPQSSNIIVFLVRRTTFCGKKTCNLVFLSAELDLQLAPIHQQQIFWTDSVSDRILYWKRECSSVVKLGWWAELRCI